MEAGKESISRRESGQIVSVVVGKSIRWLKNVGFVDTKILSVRHKWSISDWQGLGVGGECTYKGSAQEVFWGERTVLYSDCGGGYTNLYMC